MLAGSGELRLLEMTLKPKLVLKESLSDGRRKRVVLDERKAGTKT